jgi:hypothetical protein
VGGIFRALAHEARRDEVSGQAEEVQR